jgi:hypothetical protein
VINISEQYVKVVIVSTAQMARRINTSRKMVRKPVTKEQVRQMINSNIEHKVHTFLLGSTAWASAGLITPLTQAIVEGSDINQRDGTQILVKALKVKVSGFATSATTTIGRVIIFADLLAQGGLPAVTDLLDTATYVAGYAPTNVQRGRFKILYDKPMVLVDTASNSGVMRELIYKLNHKVNYSGSGNTTGANGKGVLCILFISSSSNGTYNFSVETTFTDA